MSLGKFPMPTLDRPFGIELWPVFAKVYSAVMGYSPTDFEFVPGATPMSTLKETAVTLGVYYVVVLGGRELMRNRKPFVINGAFMLHNLYLTAISATLLALFIEQLLPTIVRNGLFFAICNEKGGWTKELVTLYYVWASGLPCSIGTDIEQLNYLTKYLELLDTLFLVLKKKPLSTLLSTVLELVPDDFSFFAHLPPRSHGCALLFSAHRANIRLLGSYLT